MRIMGIFFTLSIFGFYFVIWELPLLDEGAISPATATSLRALFVGIFFGNIGHAVHSFFDDVTSIRRSLEKRK
jgi:hypothetical protein